MNHNRLQQKLDRLFPLPDKANYEGAGEAYYLEKRIVEDQRAAFIKAYQIQKQRFQAGLGIGFIAGIATCCIVLWLVFTT